MPRPGADDGAGSQSKLHALGVFHRQRLAGAQRLLGHPLLGAIAQHFHEADNGPFVAEERRHLAIGPEVFAALALMPPFVVPDAGRECQLHLDLGAIGSLILRREEAIDGLTAHLGFGPAQDALGACVPSCDQSVAVGGDDRIVDRTVEDLTVASFAFADGPFRHHLTRGLDARAEKARNLTGLVADRRVGVGEVRLLRIAVSLHHQHDVVGMRGLACIGILDQRPEIVDDLAPDIEKRSTQRLGMVPLQHRYILVVVQQLSVRTPDDEHWLICAQHDAHQRLERLGPAGGVAEFGLVPRVGLDALCQLGTARHKP